MKRSDKAFAFTLVLLLGVCIVGVLIYAGKSGSPSVLSTFLPAPEAGSYSAEPESSASSGSVISSSAAPEDSEKEAPDSKPVKSKTSSSSRSSSRVPQSSSSSAKNSDKFYTAESESEKEKININEATVEQIEVLPHFNHVRAMVIVEYREQNGPFESLSELLEIEMNENLTLELLAELFTV